MSKIYFEMNDKERQLRHIGEAIDYAICVFSEGLTGSGEYSIPIEEVNELQSKISDQLLEVQASTDKLLKAVEEKEKLSSLVFKPVYGDEDIKCLQDCKVHIVKDIDDPKNNLFATEIVFHNETTGRYRSLMKDTDGDMSLSQWY